MSRDWWENPFSDDSESYNPFTYSGSEAASEQGAHLDDVVASELSIDTLDHPSHRERYLRETQKARLGHINLMITSLIELHDNQQVHGEIGLSAVRVKLNEQASVDEVSLMPTVLETQIGDVPYVISTGSSNGYPPESEDLHHVTQSGDVYMLAGLIRELLQLKKAAEQINRIKQRKYNINQFLLGDSSEARAHCIQLVLSIFLDKMQAVSPENRPTLDVVRQIMSAYTHTLDADSAMWEHWFKMILAQWLPVAKLSHPLTVMLFIHMESIEFNLWDLSRIQAYDQWASQGVGDLGGPIDQAVLERMVSRYSEGDEAYAKAIIGLSKLGRAYDNEGDVTNRLTSNRPPFMDKNLKAVMMLERIEAAPGFSDGIYLTEDNATPTPEGEVVDRLTWLKRNMALHQVTGFLLYDLKDTCLDVNPFSMLKEYIYEPLKERRQTLINVFKPEYVDAQINLVDQQLLKLFKQEYMRQYGRLFHNPFSSMRLRIKEGRLNSIEDVFRYQNSLAAGYGRQSDCFGREVETRTERVLAKLH